MLLVILKLRDSLHLLYNMHALSLTQFNLLPHMSFSEPYFLRVSCIHIASASVPTHVSEAQERKKTKKNSRSVWHGHILAI